MSHRPDDPDELGRLLHDAVEDVHPHGTPADIRRRSEEGDTMTNPGALSRWLPLSVAAAVAMVLVIGGTAWLTNRGDDAPPVAGPSKGSTSQTPGPTATTSTEPRPSPSPTDAATSGTVTRALPVYFAGETLAGPRLFREFQRGEVCNDEDCAWVEAVDRAVAGTPIDRDYRTLWPAGAGVDMVGVNQDGLITVSITGAPRERPAGMTAAAADLAVQQVVYTAQAIVNDGRQPVQLLLDGQHSDQVLGVPTSEPLAEDDADSTLAPVQIFTPAEGAEVESGFEVTGQAAAFEANVQWELRQGDKVVDHGFTTAAECCTLAPYSFTVTDVAPGQYTLVVHDDDASGMGRTNEDSKQITVVP
ncbi:MAG TPA: Gmad2 immunoglobulin-like domain-containing protein [Marmoricola sp.]|jgi:hypothetical protein|nr:Gmad2 immunoglobulin-like domain-containing protein [Marmoricola sp.]